MPKGVYVRDEAFRQRLRDKQRETHLGRKAAPATIAKQSAAGKGKPKPKAWREKMSGSGNGNFRHGLTRTPTWYSWNAMKIRCLYPRSEKYAYYGALGITICERWMVFENFLADMGERPEGTTLDRIDPYGNYEPGNCRWATAVEQRANQRQRPVLG